MNKPVSVLIFGTFDHLHDGHRFFIREAQKLGNILIISVARDASVHVHKSKQALQQEDTRLKVLSNEFPDTQVRLGDEHAGSWKILNETKPDIIALGYDQHALKEALEAYYINKEHKPEIVTIKDHKGDTLHSSLLTKRTL